MCASRLLFYLVGPRLRHSGTTDESYLNAH